MSIFLISPVDLQSFFCFIPEECAAKGVGSVMVWTPTDKLQDEDSECHVIHACEL